MPATVQGEGPRRGPSPHVVPCPCNREPPPGKRASRAELPILPVPGEASSLRISGSPAGGGRQRSGRRETAPTPEPNMPPPPGPLGATCDRATGAMRSTGAWSAPSQKSDGPYCVLQNGSKTRWKLILGSDRLNGRRRHSLFHPKYFHLNRVAADCNSYRPVSRRDGPEVPPAASGPAAGVVWAGWEASNPNPGRSSPTSSRRHVANPLERVVFGAGASRAVARSRRPREPDLVETAIMGPSRAEPLSPELSPRRHGEHEGHLKTRASSVTPGNTRSLDTDCQLSYPDPLFRALRGELPRENCRLGTP